jgi:hypothetical protein
MEYSLRIKRPFTIDDRDATMVMVEAGARVRIEAGTVHVELDGKLYRTLDMVTPFLMEHLEKEETHGPDSR